MDGLEWKRQKYSWITRRFLMLAERWAALHSDHLIADSPVIQHYLSEKFRKTSRYIPYGAEINIQEDISVLDQWGLKRNGFYLLIARMEPENNIEMILDGFDGSNDPGRFMVVGDTANRFGQRMRKKYVHNPHIIFMDAIYEPAALFTLRKNACIYFHGHSVGGTNPSLLEAMAARVLIAAHDNEFNRAVLSDDAYYFKNSSDITRLLKDPAPVSTGTLMKENNFSKITEQFNWPRVSEKYELFFIQCLSQR